MISAAQRYSGTGSGMAALGDQRPRRRPARVSLDGRLDAPRPLPDLWDAARRAAAESPPPARDRRGRCRVLRRRRRRAVRRSPAPAARRQVEVANLDIPRIQRCCSQFDPRGARRTTSIREPPRGPAIEEVGCAAYGVWRDIRDPGRVHRRDGRGAGLRGAAIRRRALAGRVADLRARRRRRAADRRADLVPARR